MKKCLKYVNSIAKMHHLYTIDEKFKEQEFTIREIMSASNNTLQISGGIETNGPIISIEIYRNGDDLIKFYQNSDTSIKRTIIPALIDTGADLSSIDIDIINSLDLPAIGNVKSKGFGNEIITSQKHSCAVYNSIFGSRGVISRCFKYQFCP